MCVSLSPTLPQNDILRPTSSVYMFIGVRVPLGFVVACWYPFPQIKVTLSSDRQIFAQQSMFPMDTGIFLDYLGFVLSHESNLECCEIMFATTMSFPRNSISQLSSPFFHAFTLSTMMCLMFPQPILMSHL